MINRYASRALLAFALVSGSFTAVNVAYSLTYATEQKVGTVSCAVYAETRPSMFNMLGTVHVRHTEC